MKHLVLGLLLLGVLTMCSCAPRAVAVPTETASAPPSTLTPTETSTPPPRTLTPDADYDFGIISQEPCGPPCFKGIRPSVTTIADAKLIVRNANLPCHVTDELRGDFPTPTGTPPTQRNFIFCVDENPAIFTVYQPMVAVSAREGDVMVREISLYPPAKITAGQLIVQYGPPDRLLVTALRTFVMMSFYYDRLQTVFGFPQQRGTTYTIASDTVVKAAIYFSVADYQGRTSPAYFIRHQLLWQGYGEYLGSSITCPPECN